MMTVTILYFAWIRERIGHAEEQVDLPGDVRTVGALLDWLRVRGPEYAAALTEVTKIRVAVNQDHADLTAPVRKGDEIAIFPPITGG